MTTDNNGDSSKAEKGGYRSLNVGYSPKEQRGYIPSDQGKSLPKAPASGSGAKSPASGSSTTKKT